MQTLALFWSAILFILSSGLIYYERFRHNKLVVGIAVILAIGSSVSFIYAIWPGASDGTPVSSAAPAEVVTNALQPDAAASETPAEPFANNCNWDGNEAITDCISRLSRTHSPRDATYTAFYARASRAMLANDFQLADGDFGVALDNGSSATEPMVRLLRGMTRIYLRNYAGALDDCDRINNSRTINFLRTLASLSSLPAGSPESMLNFCRGIALSKLGRHHEALPVLNAAIDGNFRDRQLYEARADSREALGDAAGAASDRRIWVSMSIDALTANSSAAQDAGNAAK